MKVIKKKISLEQFKSRIPSMINFIDGNGNFVDLSDSAFTLNYYPNGCYNEVPCDIKIIKINDKNYFDINEKYLKKVYGVIDDYSKIRYSMDEYCDKYIDLKFYSLPYCTLKNMYHFFLDYIKMLRNETSCQKSISSATEYWEQEIKDEDLKSIYIDLDEQFKDYGGKIKVNNGQIQLSNFCQVVIEDIFKTFLIPNEYIDYWKTDKLYAVEALMWKRWFDEKYTLYSGITDCSLSDNCCECKEYFDRGGNEVYSALTKFNFSSYTSVTSATTSLDLPIYFQNTIDNIGEYTIFSEEWEGGVDYSKKIQNSAITIDKCGTLEKKSGGTMVIYNDELYIKNDKGNGFYNGDCKINFNFNEEQWEKVYTIPDSSYTVSVFAYDVNDTIHTFKDKETASGKTSAIEMSLKYDLIKSDYGIGFINFNNILLDIEHFKYVIEPKTQQFLKVIENNKKPYLLFNGKKYFSEGVDNSGNIIFNLTKVPCISSGRTLISKEGNFVQINDTYYSGNTYFTIDSKNYAKIDSYFKHDNKKYFLSGNTICNFNPTFYTSGTSMVTSNKDFGSSLTNTSFTYNTYGYSADTTNNKIYIFNPYEIHEYGVLTGFTSSKLDILINKNLSCDDLGKTLKGRFVVTENMKYSQPLENSTLDLYYKVGNVSDLDDVPCVSGNSDEFVTGITYWGNYLSEMEFYYVDKDGIKTSSVISASTLNCDNLSAITSAQTSWLNNQTNKNRFGDFDVSRNDIPDDLMCDFTYYLGCILIKGENKGFQLFKSDNKYFNGVKYNETFKLNKKATKFNLNKKNAYNVYYYDLEPATLQIKYNEFEVDVPKTKFEAHISHVINSENTVSGITFSSQNTMIDSPIFKDDIKLGISSLQNVKDNIYIERAIIKPHEKNLRLIDIMSIEALEKYGNGSIKILNN